MIPNKENTVIFLNTGSELTTVNNVQNIEHDIISPRPQKLSDFY
jgi:hypothetical protein